MGKTPPVEISTPDVEISTTRKELLQKLAQNIFLSKYRIMCFFGGVCLNFFIFKWN